jgi:hypothetical protein
MNEQKIKTKLMWVPVNPYLPEDFNVCLTIHREISFSFSRIWSAGKRSEAGFHDIHSGTDD